MPAAAFRVGSGVLCGDKVYTGRTDEIPVQIDLHHFGLK